MNNNVFTFDGLSENNTNIVKGQNKLTIIDAKKIYAQTGTLMIQFTHSINDTDVKINFDNCPLVTKDGNAVPFGQSKLKKIMVATNVTPKQFTPDTLCPLLIGKSFLADIEQNEKGYWVIGNNNSILPMDFEGSVVFEEEKQILNTPVSEDKPADTSILGEEEVDITDEDTW